MDSLREGDMQNVDILVIAETKIAESFQNSSVSFSWVS